MLGWAENIIGEDLVIEFLGKGVGLVEDSLMEMLDVFGPVGKYLSAQPNGSLSWDRADPNDWECFTKIDDEFVNDRFSLKTYHGTYVEMP
jgi:hypothetical protein